MRTLALPKEVEHWSMTTLRDKLVKPGPRLSDMAATLRSNWHEVARAEGPVPENPELDWGSATKTRSRVGRGNRRRGTALATGEVCLDGEKNDRVAFQARADYQNHAIRMAS